MRLTAIALLGALAGCASVDEPPSAPPETPKMQSPSIQNKGKTRLVSSDLTDPKYILPLVYHSQGPEFLKFGKAQIMVESMWYGKNALDDEVCMYSRNPERCLKSSSLFIDLQSDGYLDAVLTVNDRFTQMLKPKKEYQAKFEKLMQKYLDHTEWSA